MDTRPGWKVTVYNPILDQRFVRFTICATPAEAIQRCLTSIEDNTPTKDLSDTYVILIEPDNTLSEMLRLH